MVELSWILQSVMSSAAGLVTGFLGGMLHAMLAARKKIDDSLRAARLEHYKELWRISELLPKLPVAEKVTYADLRILSEKMRDWYFRKGGIYLSEPSRKKYGAVQEEISKVVGGKALMYEPQDEMPKMQETHLKEGLLKDEEYGRLHVCLRDLRDSMAADLLARTTTLGGGLSRRKDRSSPHR